MNAEAAARLAQSKAGSSNSTDSSSSSKAKAKAKAKTFKQGLLDGNASGPSPQEFKQQYGLPGHVALGASGLSRAAPTGDGIPPIAEIMIAGVLMFLSFRAGQESGELDEDSDSSSSENQSGGWGEIS